MEEPAGNQSHPKPAATVEGKTLPLGGGCGAVWQTDPALVPPTSYTSEDTREVA